MEEIIKQIVAKCYAQYNSATEYYKKLAILEDLILSIKDALKYTKYTVEFRTIEDHWVYSVAWIENKDIKMIMLDFDVKELL